MNRTILTVAGAFSASSLLLVDSAAKGTALLVLAAAAALILRRDSAATRHLVWLLAIAALLVVPVLSALLPQWRVLPEWAAISLPPNARQRESPPQLWRELLPPVHELSQNAEQAEFERHSPTADQEAAELPDSRPAPATPEAIAALAVSRWLNALPLVWAIGFSVLIVRLLAARMLLWNTEQQATVIWSLRSALKNGDRYPLIADRAFEQRHATPPTPPCEGGEKLSSERIPIFQQAAGQPMNASEDPLVTALEDACRQLGIHCPVTLSIHPDKTIPVVWGTLRYHLLLPAAARHWNSEQLRSVLLHELAHVRRRDMLAQLLTQVACALHWFNPLVWFAAWRLGVERERACDDLVLASGVRPSAYAGHLLDVVTGLAPARWTQTCGLAMVRRSSLEGRLVAVLSQNLNRRGVSAALAAIALAVGAGIAVPIAMLRAANNAPAQDEETASPKTKDTKREMSGDATALDDVPVRSASQAGQWRLPGGVTMEVKQETVHAADILSTAILTWPTDKEGGTARHSLILAGDAFGVREPWLLAWERGASVLWAMSGQEQSFEDFRKLKPTPRFLRRIDFADRNRITEQTWNNLPDVVPDVIRAEFDREFLPFATAPQAPADSRPNVFTSRAEDLRPVTELLSGVWKSRKGDLDVRITFPEKATNEVKWTINFERKPGGTPVSESLVRKDSTNENAVRLVKTRRQLRTLERATLGRLRRGIGDTLLLDIMPHVDFPEYDQATGIVLERAAAAGDDLPPGASSKDDASSVMKPRDESGQALFKQWQEGARTDGKIPGGALQSLADAVTNFTKLNPTHEAVPKLTEILKRIDTSHDWPPAEAVALLDDLTAIYPTLPSWTGRGGRFSPGGPIRSGQPLPAEFAGAVWGKPAANGLRAAWVLDPVAGPYPLGTMVRARILIHNSGTKTVVFRTPDWHQYANHAARDAKGKPIPVSTIPWLRLISLETIRLAPGEYAQAESEAHGIGIGPRNSHVVQWEDMRMGEWIEAKAGDDVTFLPGAVTASGDGWTAPADRKTPAQMWWAIVRDRLDREGPMPSAAADREQLIRRVMPDLIGLAPTKEEIAAFVADNSSDPLTALANRLVPRVSPFAGNLPTAEIKFRVTAADPDAAKRPRVATGPGRYTIGARVQLVIEQKPDGNLRANEARIVFFPKKANAGPPGEPFEFKLPHGNLTWAIASEPGTTVLWVTQKGLVRKIDFADPADVRETRFEDGSIADVPEHLRDAFRKALDVPGAPVQQQESQKPKDGAKLDPNAEKKAKAATDAKPAGGAKALPERVQFFNDKYSAIAVQTGNDVNFVLICSGSISTGMSDWVSGSGGENKWGFDGAVYLVDTEKTRIAKKNVNKRKIPVKFTSEAPDTLFLDGKAYRLNAAVRTTNMGARELPGRIFILRDEGPPVRTDRTLPLRNERDLVTIGDFAEHDLAMYETYAESRRVQAMEGWVLGWDEQDSIKHGDAQRKAILRIFPDGRVLSLPDGRNLTELRLPAADIAELLRWLAEDQKIGEWKPETVKANSVEFERDPVKNMWDRETEILFFMRGGKRHGIVVEEIEPQTATFRPIRERLMEALKKATPVAPAGAAPSPGPPAK